MSVLEHPTATEYRIDGTTRVRYDYEPSPGDAWLDDKDFAARWVTRWAESTGYHKVIRVTDVRRNGRLWAVEVQVRRRPKPRMTGHSGTR